MNKAISQNIFVIYIALVVVVAAIWPNPGSAESVLPISQMKTLGVFLIFFNQGVLLPGEELRKGVLEVKLHGLVQLTTYLVFPLVVGLVLWVFSPWLIQSDLRVGFLYLAFLPTTVSTAVVLTSAANGNVSGALFNCTLSSVVGIFVTPILCILFLQQGGDGSEMDGLQILVSVASTLLLPLILGQIARKRVKGKFTVHKQAVKHFNNGVILFIIWAAFCDSFFRDVWGQVSGVDLGLCLAGGTLVLVMISSWTWWMSERLHLPAPSRVTAFFCGSQKSIAVGLPMSAMIFTSAAGATVDLGLLLIPLMMYHPLQIMFSGWLIPRFQVFTSASSRTRA